MRVSIVLAHPTPGSFNHAIAREALDTLERNGHRTFFHDLYAEGFDPLLPTAEIPTETELPPEVAEQCLEIAAADGIVIVHPNWWGQPPAILKGWVDRVIRPGVAYCFRAGDSGGGVPEGLLRVRAALVFNTSNTDAQREMTVFGDPLETIWRNCIFGLCGVPIFQREVFSVVVTSIEDQRREWLRRVAEIVHLHFPPDAAGRVAGA